MIERQKYERVVEKLASLLQCSPSMSNLVQTVQESPPSILRLLLARSLPPTTLFNGPFFTASVEAARKARNGSVRQVKQLLDKIVPGGLDEGCSAQQAAFLDLLQDQKRNLFSPSSVGTERPTVGDLYVNPASGFYGICVGIDTKLDRVARVRNPVTDEEEEVPLTGLRQTARR